MKRRPVPIAALCAAVAAFQVAPAYAVDYAYFKKQSCAELAKELEALGNAEKAANDSKAKKDSKANTQAVVTTLLVGWPFWGPVDHGDANAMLAEIRADLKMVKAARKENKCK